MTSRWRRLSPAGWEWTTIEPALYSHVIFVCGPFGNGWPVSDFIERFKSTVLIGVDLSMLEPVEDWNPFAHLIERDSSRRTHPDLAFLSSTARAPLVGLCLVHPQAEYKDRGRHDAVHDALERLVRRHDDAVVPIDTRLDENRTGLRSAAQVESLIAHMDVVVTTRLHGLVLAIKNGVPVLAVDPIKDGAKISAQAAAIDWPVVLSATVPQRQGPRRGVRVLSHRWREDSGGAFSTHGGAGPGNGEGRVHTRPEAEAGRPVGRARPVFRNVERRDREGQERRRREGAASFSAS